MSYQDRLVKEIVAVLDRLENEKRPLVADWITMEICKNHIDGLGEELTEDREFWHWGGHRTTRDEVRRRINERRGDSSKPSSSQSWFPGFVHLQPYYMVVRDGEEVGIPTPDLEDDELDAKAALYRTMGKGCFEHADEIDRYKKQRPRAKRA